MVVAVMSRKTVGAIGSRIRPTSNPMPTDLFGRLCSVTICSVLLLSLTLLSPNVVAELRGDTFRRRAQIQSWAGFETNTVVTNDQLYENQGGYSHTTKFNEDYQSGPRLGYHDDPTNRVARGSRKLGAMSVQIGISGMIMGKGKGKGKGRSGGGKSHDF